MRFRLLLSKSALRAENVEAVWHVISNLEDFMKTWKARVKPAGSGASMEVQVQAKSYFDAKAMLEAKYGKGSITNGPMEAR